MEAGLVALKYIAWSIGVLTPFAGTYFFKFSEDIPGTSRKRPTRSGYIGAAVSVLGILIGLALTIASDRSATRDSAAREVAEENEAIWRERLSDSQETLIGLQSQLGESQERLTEQQSEIRDGQARTFELLGIIEENFDRLPPSAQQSVVRIAENYSLEELGEVYPDLAARVERATSVEDLFSVSEEVIGRNTAAFLVDTPECREIFPVRGQSVYRFSMWLLTDAEGYNTLRLTFWVRDTGPSIQFSDQERVAHGFSSENLVDWSTPVAFLFADDRIRAACRGDQIIADDCSISFRGGAADDLYRELAGNHLAALEVQRRDGPASYAISPDEAEMIKKAANCLKR